MNIRFPFLYTATIQVAAQQGMNEQREIRGDWAEVEIGEYAAEDTALVCQVEGYGSGGVPFLIEVRKVGSRYFRPKLVVPDQPYNPLDDGSDRLSAFELGQMVPLAASHAIRGRTDAPLHAQANSADRFHEILDVIENQIGNRIIVRDDRQEVLSRHEQAARQLVVIDGMVWEQCLEPRLSIDIGAALPQAVVTVSRPDRPIPPSSQTFPLGMADRIRDMLEEALADPEFETFPAAQERRPRWTLDEIQLPQVIYYDASIGKMPWKEALEVAREVFSALPGTHFNYYSKDYIVAWVDFRDAIRLAEAEPTPLTIKRVMDAWKTASDSADAEAVQRHGAGRAFETAKSRIVRHHSLAAWCDMLENRGSPRPASREERRFEMGR